MEPDGWPRTFPASFSEMMPLAETRLSLSVVLPWSTWARMQMLRMRSVALCSALRLSGVTRMAAD